LPGPPTVPATAAATVAVTVAVAVTVTVTAAAAAADRGTTAGVNATRWYGLVVTLIAALAVAWPLTRHPVAGDSFPLSTYPMFATRRKDARLYLEYVIATGPGGARRHVPPELVASPEVMQAIVSVHAAVARGDATGLCRRVATRLAPRAGYRGFDEVQVIAGNHRAIDWFVKGVHGTERTLARCPIARGAP